MDLRSRHGSANAPDSRDARHFPASTSTSDTRRILRYLRGKAACVALVVLIVAIIRFGMGCAYVCARAHAHALACHATPRLTRRCPIECRCRPSRTCWPEPHCLTQTPGVRGSNWARVCLWLEELQAWERDMRRGPSHVHTRPAYDEVGACSSARGCRSIPPGPRLRGVSVGVRACLTSPILPAVREAATQPLCAAHGGGGRQRRGQPACTPGGAVE